MQRSFANPWKPGAQPPSGRPASPPSGRPASPASEPPASLGTIPMTPASPGGDTVPLVYPPPQAANRARQTAGAMTVRFGMKLFRRLQVRGQEGEDHLVQAPLADELLGEERWQVFMRCLDGLVGEETGSGLALRSRRLPGRRRRGHA